VEVDMVVVNTIMDNLVVLVVGKVAMPSPLMVDLDLDLPHNLELQIQEQLTITDMLVEVLHLEPTLMLRVQVEVE